MRVVKQAQSLNVKNYDFDGGGEKLRHSVLLPSTVRCLVAGPSGCGKTNVLIALLEHPNGLRFENIYIYSKSLYQPKYIYLENLLKPIHNVGYFPHNDSTDIVKPSDAKYNSIFIFDDVACNKQDIIREYFCMGRHKAIDCFYLCQTYTRIPKHLIRDNANFIILFKQDDMNLKHVYADHVGTDMTYEQFKNICSFCWRDKYGFLVISKENNLNDGRYRKNFDSYMLISNK